MGTPASMPLFSLFLRAPDERQNHDWSKLIKYLTDCSDWTVKCYSSTLPHIQQADKSGRLENRNLGI